MVVLDTAALIYWTLDPVQLSSRARQAIEAADRLVVSSISIWEISLKVKKGKLTIPLTISEYMRRLQQVEKLEIQAVDASTWLENVALDWSHRDPADRTIVATAQRQHCPLITPDKEIRVFYKAAIW